MNSPLPQPVMRSEAASFQSRVAPWMQACYIAERNHRFLEESLELVQALGATEQIEDTFFLEYDSSDGEWFLMGGGMPCRAWPKTKRDVLKWLDVLKILPAMKGAI